jgi:hypothetical protein
MNLLTSHILFGLLKQSARNTQHKFLADPRHSSGTGTIEVIAGESVFLGTIAYTADGEAHAPDCLDVSAVICLDSSARPLCISSVALTQTGDLSGIEFSEALADLDQGSKPSLPSMPFKKNSPNSPKPMANSSAPSTPSKKASTPPSLNSELSRPTLPTASTG